jgi:hypothetical protein
VLLGLPAVQSSFITLMRESFVLLADLMRMRG